MMLIMIVLLNIFMCWIIVDFISGVGHWIEEVYFAPTKIKWFDCLAVTPNIFHHKFPGTLSRSTYLSTNVVLIIVSLLVSSFLVIHGVFTWQLYMMALFISHINQVHKWAHTSKPPDVVKFLQRLGILQSVQHHAIHHKRPL